MGKKSKVKREKKETTTTTTTTGKKHTSNFKRTQAHFSPIHGIERKRSKENLLMDTANINYCNMYKLPLAWFTSKLKRHKPKEKKHKTKMIVTNIHIHFGRRFPCEMSNSASIEYKKNTHTYTEYKRGILIFLFCTSAFRPCRVFVDWENAWENIEWCGLQSFIKPIQRIIQTNSYQINQRFLSLDFISEFFKQQMLLMKLMIMTAFENNVWRW